MIKQFLLSSIVISLLWSCQKQSIQPNVLLICIDDLNDWTGFLGGHPQAVTPHMDQLAEEGMVFRNAFCASSECNPSRISMLSGYHPIQTGFSNNFLPMNPRDWVGNDETGDPVPRYNDGPIPDMNKTVFLPEYFRLNGYYTFGCGKVFHHHGGDLEVDRERSWDEWAVQNGNDLAGGKGRNGIYDGRIVWVDWGPEDVETSETADHQRASWMAEKLRNYDRKAPFFAAVGFKKPHDPFYAPQEFFDRLPPVSEIQLPAILEEDHIDLSTQGKLMADKKDGTPSEYEIISGQNDQGKDMRYDATRAYLATTAFTDSCVGVVMEALRSSGHDKNTIVVLWSDHGWHLGEKLHYHKFTHWDQALRTILVIRAPGRNPGYTQGVVNAIDIYPTLVDLSGLDHALVQEGFKHLGHSLAPLLDRADSSWDHPSVTVNFKRFPPMIFKRRGEQYSEEFLSRSLRTRQWKMIEYNGINGESDRQYELYDMANDAEEWHNLALELIHRKTLDSLTQMLWSYGH